MKSLKPLFFVIGCITLCNTAFADQLELTNNIVYGIADDLKGVEQKGVEQKGVEQKGVEQHKPSLKQVQVKINNGDWRDVPVTYSRAPLSLNNNDQYAIRVQTADGEWYHTQPLKYSAARDGSSKNLSINGIVTPLKLVQDGIEVAYFYDKDNLKGIPVDCSYAGGIKSLVCTFDDAAKPPAPRGYVGRGHLDISYRAQGTAYVASNVKPNAPAIGLVEPGSGYTYINLFTGFPYPPGMSRIYLSGVFGSREERYEGGYK